MNNDNPFLQYSDILENRQRLRAVFLDFFPNEKAKANVLVIAYDSGIAHAIRNCEVLDNIFALKFIKVLTSDYAINNQMANWVVRYWIEMYGSQALGKYVDLSDEWLDDQSNNEPTLDITFFETTQQTRQMVSGKKIADFEDGEKLPKNIIDIQMQTFTGCGIKKFTCAVRKDYTYTAETSLKITGDYEGKTTKYITLFFMCFNVRNELVGALFDETIGDDFKGTATYSAIMHVPKWEIIQRIEVRATLDPALLW